MPMDGTTFSGHPTRTTLGNTFRSLMYMYYYLESSGFSEPWTQQLSIPEIDRVFVAASGDDVVVWTPENRLQPLKSSILALSGRSKKDELSIGLGQCIGEVFTGAWHEIDF